MEETLFKRIHELESKLGYKETEALANTVMDEESGEELSNSYDKILWIIRKAYIMGYTEALSESSK